MRTGSAHGCRPSGDDIDEQRKQAGSQLRSGAAAGVGVEQTVFQLAVRIGGFLLEGRHDARCAGSV